jgi:hypothetical protein
MNHRPTTFFSYAPLAFSPDIHELLDAILWRATTSSNVDFWDDAFRDLHDPLWVVHWQLRDLVKAEARDSTDLLSDVA